MGIDFLQQRRHLLACTGLLLIDLQSSLVLSSNLSYQFMKAFVYVDSFLGAGLIEGDTIRFGKELALVGGHFSLGFQIYLVANEYHGYREVVLHSSDQFSHGIDLLEGSSGGDIVDEEEALSGSHVLIAHCRVFFLASSIQNIQQTNFVVDDQLLAIGIFDSGIILDDTMGIDKEIKKWWVRSGSKMKTKGSSTAYK